MRARAMLACAAIALLSAPQAYAEDPDAEAPAEARRERMTPPKPQHTVLTGGVEPGVIVLKFREGSHVRQRTGRLVIGVNQLTVDETGLLQRAGLTRAAVAQQLGTVNQLLGGSPRRHVARLFSRAEDVLDRETADAEQDSDEELADPNLYYHVLIDNAQPAESAALIDALNTLNVVEIAYAEPIPEDAAVDIAPTTPNFLASQRYLNAAPVGIDAFFAAQFPGAKGDGVRVIDIERNWNLGHEDLNPVFFQSGLLTGSRQHGTAVLGEIAAAENAFGMTGIAPRCTTGVSSVNRASCNCVNFADAFDTAAAQLTAGDVVLIEQHQPGPDSGLACACNCSQFEFVPMEFTQANFDAIRRATSRGIIVVEAAGNGGMNLDSAIYNGRFNRAVRDSGAILVGAGTSNGGRVPECFTNFGSRVDAHGWGDGVATLGCLSPPPNGVCLAQVNGADDRQWYTSSFSGTSSASPIVTGAAISIQGHRRARGLPVLNSTRMRSLLRGTGTAQATDPRQIGPLPNLRSAITAHGSTGPVRITPSSTAQSVAGFVAPQGFRDFVFRGSFLNTFAFTTCNNADFDTVLEIRSANGQTLIASNDDTCGLQSLIRFRAGNTNDFIVRVRGFASASGAFRLGFVIDPGSILLP